MWVHSKEQYKSQLESRVQFGYCIKQWDNNSIYVDFSKKGIFFKWKQNLYILNVVLTKYGKNCLSINNLVSIFEISEIQKDICFTKES